MKNIKNSKKNLLQNISQTPKNTTKQKINPSDFFAIEEDFIPYATHFNESTILTKNLQVLQTIKVNSFLNKDLHHDVKHITLREALREAIQKNIKSDDFAFWIHTIRRKADLHDILHTKNEQVSFLNQKWNDYNHFEFQFINELYLTVLIKGVEIRGKDVATRYFTDEKLKAHIDESLEKKAEILTISVNGIIADLENYSPKKLQIVERDGVLYSENIEFFHKILNLTDISAELDEADISSTLAISKMSLLQNKFNLKSDFSTHSISVLTLKHYLETNLEILDNILKLQFEFIIYQAFDFINIEEVSDKYENQYKMLKISKDREMLNFLGLADDEFSDEKSETERKVKYGENQIGIIIIGENEEKLETETQAIVNVLSKTGFVAVREDVMIEDTFFSSLPGNFFFLRRMQPIQTRKVGGFASIDNYPIGKIYKNLWGDALALFKSKEKSPYFFNFHDDSGAGHTMIFGKYYDIQKTALTNFLEYQSLKYSPRIINIDGDENTKLFNAFIGGDFKKLSQDKSENTLKLNPFTAFSGKYNEAESSKFLETFLNLSLKFSVKEADTHLKYLNEKILPFGLKNRTTFLEIKDFISAITNEKVIKTFFQEVSKGGTFEHAFDSKENDLLDLKNDFLSIDIGDIMENMEAIEFFFNYFIENILLLTKDKKRTIIKIDNFFEMCDICNFSEAKIIQILKTLKENNVILIMLETYHFFQEYKKEKSPDIMELISTQIFMPAFVKYDAEEPDIANNYLSKISKFINLTPHELDVIADISFDIQHFSVKHADKIIALEFNPAFNVALYFILANREIQNDLLINLKEAKTFEAKLEEIESLLRQLLS